MTLFSEVAWHCTARLREAVHALPFNAELAHGSLSRERFQAYIVQDALYLEQYARELTMAAARAPDRKSLQVFAQSAPGVVTVERAQRIRYRSGALGGRRAVSRLSWLHELSWRHRLPRAVGGPDRGIAAVLLDISGCGVCDRPTGSPKQPVSCPDRHLRRRGVRPGGAGCHRDHRPSGSNLSAAGAYGVHFRPASPVRVAVLGRRLSATTVAGCPVTPGPHATRHHIRSTLIARTTITIRPPANEAVFSVWILRGQVKAHVGGDRCRRPPVMRRLLAGDPEIVDHEHRSR